jgi:hypothetical protein
MCNARCGTKVTASFILLNLVMILTNEINVKMQSAYAIISNNKMGMMHAQNT